MIHSLLKWKSVAIVAAIAALVFAIACGDPEPEVDTAQLIQDAVASAQSASAAEIESSVAAAIAAQPQGASAAEIQKLVSDSVTAAIAAQPAGLTRADVESIVSRATAEQLSAADVETIVDQSFRALPAPEIDANQLTSLVNAAVADAVPQGVSAGEISRIVQAQVSAGLSGTLTRGDIEDLVASAVEDAVGDQLTADQVTNIVNASLVATNQAIENAAAEAAQAAAAAAAAQEAASAAREAPAPSGPPVQVVTTTNFVADWARVVGGDRAEVFSLLPVGGDPHTFLPGARDVARVADADLVLTVGLDLEAEWLEDLLHNASADESKIVALGEAVDPLEYAMADAHDDHEGEAHDDHEEEGHDDHEGEGHDDHDEMTIGRLLVADAVEAHLSVIDLSTDDVDSGIFEVAAPRATVYPSPTHRYGIVLARGPEDDDDRVHVFDGGVFLVEHGDHYDLVQEPVSRHSLEIAEERPIHYVNSHGWTAIFTDAHGHVILINEADLANSSGDYEPIVLEAGPQHGAALVISDEHIVIVTHQESRLHRVDPDAACLSALKFATFDDHVVYDASNRLMPGHARRIAQRHGAAFGCASAACSSSMLTTASTSMSSSPIRRRCAEDSRIGSVYGHHHVEHFFGRASYRGDQGFVDDGIWLIDVDHGEMRQVFSEPSVSTKFSSDGELLYVLGLTVCCTRWTRMTANWSRRWSWSSREIVFGRPAMIVVGEWLYVADPNSGHVLAVHLEEHGDRGGVGTRRRAVEPGVPRSQDSDGAPHEGDATKRTATTSMAMKGTTTALTILTSGSIRSA